MNHQLSFSRTKPPCPWRAFIFSFFIANATAFELLPSPLQSSTFLNKLAFTTRSPLIACKDTNENKSTLTVLHVSTSQDEEATQTSSKETKIPYSIARGDGSTGGGGLPMPKSSKKMNEILIESNDENIDENLEEEDDLVRPKVC